MTQEREQQSEQTLLTVLQQGVADAIYFINSLREKNLGATDFHLVRYQDEEAARICGSGYFSIHHSAHVHMPDEVRPLVQFTSNPFQKYIQMPTPVARHIAVLNALEALLLEIGFSKRVVDRELKTLRERQILDLEAMLRSNNVTYFTRGCPSDGPSSSPLTIPQLNLTADVIYEAEIPNSIAIDPFAPLWKVRERLRMHHGLYVKLPADVLALLPTAIVEDQIPHVAVRPDNAGMIAYTQSPIAGALDRQQVIKPGRYIRQHCPDITAEQVKQAAAACIAATSAGFHHSSDAEDFARVYIDGPSSCMSYDASGKLFGRLIVGGKFFHPARVYAHPDNDLEIVWFEAAGRIGARAIINKANKKYPRIYNSDSVRGASERLSDYLEALGYSQADDALDGQKLLKVSPDRYPNAIICPYIDCGNRGVEVYNEHLVVNGSEEADHETGCLIDYNTADPDWYCGCCDEGYSDNDEAFDTNDHDHVCHSCANDSYTWAYSVSHGYSMYVNDNETFYSGRYTSYGNKQLWFDDGLDAYEFVELDAARYGHGYVAPYEECVQDANDEWVLRDDLGRFELFFCEDEDVAYPIADWAVLDGELAHRDGLPENIELQPLESHSDYPMLPVYQSVDVEEVEDAA